MNDPHIVTMHIDVFDEALLIRTATEHAKVTGRDHGLADPVVTDAADALIVLLDPGSGGGAYQGSCSEAGFQIEESTAARLKRT